MTFQRTHSLFLLVVVLAAGIGGAFAVTGGLDFQQSDGVDGEFEQFSSEAEFRQYLRDAQTRSGSSYMFTTSMRATNDVVVEETADAGAPEAEATKSYSDDGASDSPRYSETNRQEASIDEPDIVKTDGETLYYSRDRGRYHHSKRSSGTVAIDALPPEAANVTANVDATGQLLLVNDTLVVIGHDKVTGFDVSNSSSPEQVWERSLDSMVVTARLHDNTIYLVTATRLDTGDPCPVEPAGDVVVECTDIHRPSEPVDVDATYTAMTIDAPSGEVTDSVSYLGSRRNTVVYMSEDALYTTYVETENRADLYMEFLLTDARPILSDDAVERLERLDSYELSDRAKQIEARSIVHEWLAMQSEEEREESMAELESRYEDYAAENQREYATTNVVKITLEGGLSVDAKGEVPGRPLNQFSLDEHDGHLRIATTIDGPRSRWGSVDSVNDLYVLDENLEVTGSVTDMGVDERIYSVRYVGDKAYVVTFKRIDPFHVLDLSDPSDPTLEGELKLPGFSSYLHPLGDDRVLGLGEENGKVKAVIFNVSDPTNPVVEDDYIVDDRWSEIRQTHHAFLLDEKHGVFFLPGSDGGYVFSYENGLELEKTVETERPRRAVYINDHMYVFSESEVVVLDENTWERVHTVDLVNA